MWLLAILLRWDRAGRLRPVPLQGEEAAAELADLAPQARMESWHLVSPAGERWSAGAALAPMLRLLPHGALAAALAERFPAPVERGYRWVAAHRSRLGRLVRPGAKRAGAARIAGRERRFHSRSRG
jgi:predicted DCC family thiol-disulfide oxidoreductase YuxK